MVGFALGQLTMPEEGWELLEKGEEKKEGKRILGVWQNEEKTILVGAAWDTKMPEFRTLFDLPLPKQDLPGVDPPPHWPKGVEVMPEPLVGLKITFATNGDEILGEREHYWLYGEGGGVFLKVFVKDGAKFDPKEWKAGRPVAAMVAEKKRLVLEAVQGIDKMKIPLIEIDPNLKPTVKGDPQKDGARKIVVVVRKDGVFEMKGKELDLVGVEAVLKDRFRKFGEDGVLHIRAEAEVEFKYVQRLIKVGAKVGLKKVAYAAFGSEEKGKADE